DTGESVGAAECEPEHDVRLEELPVDAEHRERNDVMHRASATPLPSGPMAAAHSRASRSAAPHPVPGAAPRGCRALVQLVLLLPDAGLGDLLVDRGDLEALVALDDLAVLVRHAHVDVVRDVVRERPHVPRLAENVGL